MRQPCQAGKVIHLAADEAGTQVTILAVREGKDFLVTGVGVNAFMRPGQKLFAAFHVILANDVGTYLIVLVARPWYIHPPHFDL